MTSAVVSNHRAASESTPPDAINLQHHALALTAHCLRHPAERLFRFPFTLSIIATKDEQERRRIKDNESMEGMFYMPTLQHMFVSVPTKMKRGNIAIQSEFGLIISDSFRSPSYCRLLGKENKPRTECGQRLESDPPNRLQDIDEIDWYPTLN